MGFLTFCLIWILFPGPAWGDLLNEREKWKSLSRVWLFVTPWTVQSMEFSRPEYWSGEPFPSPGDLPNPGIEPRSPALQVDSLPAEQGKPKNTGVGSLSLLQWIPLPRNRTRVYCIAGGFFTNWAIREKKFDQFLKYSAKNWSNFSQQTTAGKKTKCHFVSRRENSRQ